MNIELRNVTIRELTDGYFDDDEEGVVGYRHLPFRHRPGHILAEDLAVIGGIRDTGAAPVLGVDEVGAFEGLHLVVFYLRATDEFRIEFIAFRV